MNKLLALFFLTIFFSCQNTPTKIVSQKWENGKTKILLTYDNSNDSLTYLREFFYENGQLGTKGNYINGKQDGLWEWWYENGNKMDEATLNQGFYIGQRKHWYENGNLKQIEIISDKCSGDCCDGKVINYYENGQIESEGAILNGLRTGKYIYKFDNGQIMFEEYFHAGVKEGRYMEWYKTGEKWAEGFYRADQQDSVWTWFDSTGNITTVAVYKDGELVKTLK